MCIPSFYLLGDDRHHLLGASRMASDFEFCSKVLGTHVLESFKDFGQRIYEEPGVEFVHIDPLSVRNGFAQTTLSFLRKGDADDSSIVFGCTGTGAMTVSIFITGTPVNGPAAPAIVTREWVDDMISLFVKRVFTPSAVR
jgi:hypothetical protein